MPKISDLSDVANITGNEQSAANTINTNNQRIEDALQNTLSRDGSSPNSMGADLDMNGNQILNLPAATTSTEPVRKAEFDTALEDVTGITELAEQVAEDAAEVADALDDVEEIQADLMAVLDAADVLYIRNAPPGPSDGFNGDMWIDISDVSGRNAIYGPKTAGAWGSIVGYQIGQDGTVAGPVTTVVDNVVAWDSTDGTTTKDTGLDYNDIATQSFVTAAIDAIKGGVSSAFDTLAEIATELALKATIASPTFTGNPAAPTPSADDNDTSIATTAYVRTQIPREALMQGTHTIWVPAAAMISRTTNGAAVGTVEMSSNKNMIRSLDFDASTQEFAQFSIAMPKSWNEGTVTFQPSWSHASTTTNFGVVWALEAVATSDDDALDVAFGTAQTSTDTGGTTNDRYIGPESSAITIGGSPAEGDIVQFQIKRNVSDGSDTLAVDARLHGIKVYLSLNAGNDA